MPMTIEEIEKEVRRLFGNNDVPIDDFIQIVDNIKSRRKIVVKRKK